MFPPNDCVYRTRVNSFEALLWFRLSGSGASSISMSSPNSAANQQRCLGIVLPLDLCDLITRTVWLSIKFLPFGKCFKNALLESRIQLKQIRERTKFKIWLKILSLKISSRSKVDLRSNSENLAILTRSAIGVTMPSHFSASERSPSEPRVPRRTSAPLSTVKLCRQATLKIIWIYVIWIFEYLFKHYSMSNLVVQLFRSKSHFSCARGPGCSSTAAIPFLNGQPSLALNLDLFSYWENLVIRWDYLITGHALLVRSEWKGRVVVAHAIFKSFKLNAFFTMSEL